MELTESSRRIAHVAGVRHLSGLPPASARMHCIQSALSEGSNDGRRNGGGGGHAGSVSRASRLTAADAPAARPFWLLRLPTRLGGRTSCSQTALPPPPPPPCVRLHPPGSDAPRPRRARLSATSSGARTANRIGPHSFSACFLHSRASSIRSNKWSAKQHFPEVLRTDASKLGAPGLLLPVRNLNSTEAWNHQKQLYPLGSSKRLLSDLGSCFTGRLQSSVGRVWATTP